MGEMIFDQASLRNDHGEVWLQLRLSPQSFFEARRFIANKQDKPYRMEIKRHYNKRSMDANAYCWVLCEAIAESIRATKEEIYRQAIGQVGAFVELWVPECDARGVMECWEKMGLGWMAFDMGTTKGFTTIHAYKGSSAYDTKEMSRLLDWLVEEAEGLGLETRTPDEIERMKSLWDEKQAV
jgi:hypothetical protein